MGKMRVVQDEELTTLPIQIVESAAFRCTPAQLFASFERDEDWKQWLDIKVTRTTEGPYRVGFTRTVRGGPLTLDEVFTVWSPNRAMAFYMERSNNPLIRAFAERWTVTETPTGCTLEWRVGIEMHWAGRLLGPVLKLALTRSARRGFPKLEQLAAGSPPA